MKSEMTVRNMDGIGNWTKDQLGYMLSEDLAALCPLSRTLGNADLRSNELKYLTQVSKQ